MKAAIFYYTENISTSDETVSGWYLMRATLVHDGRGRDSDREAAKGWSITDRTPIAKFGAGAAARGMHDTVWEQRQFADAVRSGGLVLLPADWNLDSALAALKKAGSL